MYCVWVVALQLLCHLIFLNWFNNGRRCIWSWYSWVIWPPIVVLSHCEVSVCSEFWISKALLLVIFISITSSRYIYWIFNLFIKLLDIVSIRFLHFNPINVSLLIGLLTLQISLVTWIQVIQAAFSKCMHLVSNKTTMIQSEAKKA